MNRVDPDDLAPLRELLHATAPMPAERVAELARARIAALGQGQLAAEVMATEGRWLLATAAPLPGLAAAHATAAAAWRDLAARNLAAAPPGDVDVLFELAEAFAEHRLRGDEAGAAAVAAELRARAAAPLDTAAVLQEADERWAAQPVNGSGAELRRQIEVQRATGDLLAAIAQRTGDRRLRARARRARRGAADGVRQLRLERLLGERGRRWLEATSFWLLVLVVAVLLVELLVPLPTAVLQALHWVDAGAGAFFVVEFALGVLLVPARVQWVWRNVWTDLLPALPSLWLVWPGTPLPAAVDQLLFVRLLRLRVVRLVLLLVRGTDGIVRRFRRLLDRRFVFLADGERQSLVGEERRGLVFAALRRERSLWSALPPATQLTLLGERLREFATRCAAQPGCWPVRGDPEHFGRDVAVESACQFLWTLRPGDLERHLSSADLRALDRVVRVVSSPPLCWLPILARFAVRPLPAVAEERVVAAGRRVADWLMGWQDRLLFYADLHGIVTGPQILDRVASAMVKASQRPAVRLLFFGGLFLLFDMLIKSEGISRWLQTIVVGPLLVLGSVCLVFLLLGWWLKRVAGEASESFRTTAEAHFVSLLHLVKWRHEATDVEFLSRRVLADVTAGDPVQLLQSQLQGTRTGVPRDVAGFDAREEAHGSRVALLYLHFLDGALLHSSDVKTTEQLLANLSLENLRHGHLGYTKKRKKLLRRLRLDDGSVLRGPFLWFRFITESIAVETSKRITEYNRRCVPLGRRRTLPAAEEQQLQAWLQRRRDPAVGRTLERLPPPDAGTVYASTDFHALHFLTADRERDAYLQATFGDDVLAAVRADRRNMIREIFGMRPPQQLDESMRALNVWTLYWARLSHGRVLLLPLLFAWRFLRGIGWFVARIRQIVREVLTPHLAMQRRQPGTSTFAVAVRKIHRMKAPGLLEAIRMRVRVDPAYSGAPAGWTPGVAAPVPAVPEIERDLDFLLLHERERAVFREQAADNRELVAALHAAIAWLPELGSAGAAEPTARADGELAVTVAWLCDRGRVRTLLQAEHWRTTELPRLLERRIPTGLLRRFGWQVHDLFAAHPVDVWLVRQRIACRRRGRRSLRRAYAEDARVRATIDAWNALRPGEGPAQAAVARLREFHAHGDDVRRELVALRTVQSLSVLDVRNYRHAVFELGGYGDHEDGALARTLP